MDTRSKIVTPDEVKLLLARPADTAQVAVVVGFFDPLTLEVAQLFNGTAANLRIVAVVLDGPQTLHTAEARAILIAALRSVHRVTIAPHDSWQSLLPENFAGTLHFDPDEDARRTQDFAAFILRKQSTASV